MPAPCSQPRSASGSRTGSDKSPESLPDSAAPLPPHNVRHAALLKYHTGNGCACFHGAHHKGSHHSLGTLAGQCFHFIHRISTDGITRTGCHTFPHTTQQKENTKQHQILRHTNIIAVSTRNVPNPSIMQFRLPSRFNLSIKTAAKQLCQRIDSQQHRRHFSIKQYIFRIIDNTLILQDHNYHHTAPMMHSRIQERLFTAHCRDSFRLIRRLSFDITRSRQESCSCQAAPG